MSVITTVEFVPSRMMGVFRYLLSIKGHIESRDRLQHLLSPAREKRDMISDVINEMVQMGLCVKTKADDGDTQIALAPETLDYYGRKNFDLSRLKLLMLRCLLGNLGDESNTRNHDFCLHLTWFLSQDPFTPLGNQDEIIARLQQAFGDHPLIIRSNLRYENFRYWARFLGFGWEYELPGKPAVFVPDPREYLQLSLAELFGADHRLTMKEFIGRLLNACPLFPGGRWHTEAGEAVMQTPSAVHLPRSLGYALLQLRDEGVVRLEKQSDAPYHMIIEEDGAPQNYAFIELVSGKRGK